MAKVVLVEDDPVLVEMYTIKFEEEGFSILSATNGEAGLDLIRQQKPDVALVDIMMPKMDGFAVLDAISKDSDLKNIPVLLLTNLSQKDDIDKGKKLGAVDYIVKASLTPAQVVEQTKKHIK